MVNYFQKICIKLKHISNIFIMMNKENNEEMISVPRWVLENIEDTLRIQYNIYEGKTDTCQKRNIKTSLIQARKLLKNEEITGNERLETYK